MKHFAAKQIVTLTSSTRDITAVLKVYLTVTIEKKIEIYGPLVSLVPNKLIHLMKVNVLLSSDTRLKEWKDVMFLVSF